MTKIYKLGVLGLGEGRSVLSAAISSTHYQLGKICDLNEALCLERTAEFQLPSYIYTTSYQEMLDDPSIDVIGIYTPDQFHGLHIRQALEAGKHVLCTKPVLTDLSDADALLALAKEMNRQVFVGQSSRFFEPMMLQRRDYDSGQIGDLATVEAFYKTDARWFLKKSWSHTSGFSWIYNFMIHAVDLACWYLPEIGEVYAMAHLSSNTTVYGLDIPDTIKCLFKDVHGRIAQVEGSYTAPTLGPAIEPSISCTLRGTKGTSRGEYPNLVYHHNYEDEESTTQDLRHLSAYYFRFEGQSHHAGEYQNYMDCFAQSLDAGLTPNPDLAEATQVLKIMKAIDESLASGQPTLL